MKSASADGEYDGAPGIDMAEMTTEVCDAEPSYVEQNVDEFADKIKR